MRNLLLSSVFLLLLLSSCKFGHYGRLQTTGEPPAYYPNPAPIFGDNFNSFLFKTNITVYGKDFSGLLVTKQLSPQDYRVIFTTELGMKLFDFEFKDTAFTLHYCVPQFNKPKLLKTIQHDIETLLMNGLQDKMFEGLHDKKGSYDHVSKLKTGSRYNYYFYEKDSKHLIKIEHSKKRIKKTTFTLSNHQNDFPNHIVIKHHDIKLKIELNLLKR
jgi:hypothetical protein